MSEITLLRLYDLHTKLLPAVLILLIGAHILAVTILGFAKIEGMEGNHLFYPGHVMKVGLIAVSLLILVVNMVMIFPPPLGPVANPQEVAPNVAPPWYFSAVYKWITIAPRQPALFGILFLSGIFFLYPFMDRFLTGRGFNMGRINIVIGTAAVSAFAILTLWNVIAG